MKAIKQNHSRYLLPDNINSELFLDSCSKYFTVEKTDSLTENISILDSFSWQLYSQKLLAVQFSNNTISLWNEKELLDTDLSMTIKKTKAKARFWWDFPDSPVRDILKNTLKLRALCPVYQGTLKLEQFNLQNEDGKILLYCQIISFSDQQSLAIGTESSPETSSESNSVHQIKLLPVTGYSAEYKQVVNLIKDLGGFESRLEPLDSLFRSLGVTPQPFDVKPALSFSGDLPSREAASTIVNIMLDKQRQTESGIIDDIDSEFLHHFRVALRMVRAAIVQLKEVFPENDVVMLKQRLGDIARETNKLRDLDVFILDKDRYMNLLPKSLRDGLLPMFRDFEKNRISEVKRISSWLSGKEYKQEISELQALFENGYSAIETRWSERPAIEIARKKIIKSYKKIQNAAANITPDTPDETIHSIRIDCKKLRYLLYFFGSLFSKKRVKQAGEHLKSLQDTLGIFNDLTVQEIFLENYLDQIEHKPKKDIFLIAALGGLISTLHILQKQERENCISELVNFSNSENCQLFDKTFNSQDKAKKF